MSNKPSKEENLAALLYQFTALHDRWSEERQIQIKNGVKVKELVEKLSEETTRFASLESQVRNKLAYSIEESTGKATSLIADEISKEASTAMSKSIKQLERGLEDAERVLENYKLESQGWLWKTGFIVLLTSVLTSFILFKFVMPKPVVVNPWTDQQLQTWYKGFVVTEGEKKLSEKEKEQWNKLLAKAETTLAKTQKR